MQGTRKPGGPSWWAELSYAFQLSLTPSIGAVGILAGTEELAAAETLSLTPLLTLTAAEHYAATFTASLTPAISMSGVTETPATEAFSLTPVIGMAGGTRTPATFTASLTPAISMGGVTETPATEAFSLTPVIGMAGGTRTPADFSIVLPATIGMSGGTETPATEALSLTPVIGMVGAEHYSATMGLSLTPVIGMVGATGAVLQFVTVDSGTGNLLLNGKRFKAAGGNITIGLTDVGVGPYGATAVGGLHLPTHSEIDATINACVSMHANTVRAWSAVLSVGSTLAVQPTLGTWNNTAFETVDYALSLFQNNGIKLILPLVDNYQYYANGKFWYCSQNGVTPDGTASQFFSNTTVINSFKAHISAVLNHVNQYTGVPYKEDSSILCWETGNELDGASTQAVLDTWTQDIAAYIKSQGAQQLVMDGNAVSVGSVNTPGVDVYTSHLYHNGALADVTTWGAAVHANSKALVVGEFTWTDQAFSVALDWKLHQLLGTVESFDDVDGGLFWEMLAPGMNKGTNEFALEYPGSPPTGSSESDRIKWLTEYAQRMSGEPLPAHFLQDTFTDTNGASVTTHTGEIGATWAAQLYQAGDWTIQNNRAYSNSGIGFIASGVPPSPNYQVDMPVNIVSAASGSYIRVCARAVTLYNTKYDVTLTYTGTSWTIDLRRVLRDAVLALGSTVTITSPTVGSDHTLSIRTVDDTISALWDGNVVIGPIVNDDLPFAGHPAISGSAVTSTTGIHAAGIDARTILSVADVGADSGEQIGTDVVTSGPVTINDVGADSAELGGDDTVTSVTAAVRIVASTTATFTASRAPSATFSGYTPVLNHLVCFFAISGAGLASSSVATNWVRPTPNSGANTIQTNNHSMLFEYHWVTSAEVAAGTNSWTATSMWAANQTGNLIAVILENVNTTTPIDSFRTQSSNTSDTTHTVNGAVATDVTFSSDLWLAILASDVAENYSTPPSGGTGTWSSVIGVTTAPAGRLWVNDTLSTAGVAMTGGTVTATAAPWADMSILFTKA